MKLVSINVTTNSLTNFVENNKAILECSYSSINSSFITSIIWSSYNYTNDIDQLNDKLIFQNNQLIFKNLSRYIYDASYYCGITFSNLNNNAIYSINSVEFIVACKAKVFNFLVFDMNLLVFHSFST